MAAPLVAPGFRFYPRDEELLSYLRRKVSGRKIEPDIIPEIGLYDCEPWDLPDKSPLSNGDSQWYFFTLLKRRYHTGSRINRATKAGYWKASGRGRKIASQLGVKRTLVFYTGRTPQGEQTDWVMHEYSLDGAAGLQDTFVLCRIFKKKGTEHKNGEQNDAQIENNIEPTPSHAYVQGCPDAALNVPITLIGSPQTPHSSQNLAAQTLYELEHSRGERGTVQFDAVNGVGTNPRRFNTNTATNEEEMKYMAEVFENVKDTEETGHFDNRQNSASMDTAPLDHSAHPEHHNCSKCDKTAEELISFKKGFEKMTEELINLKADVAKMVDLFQSNSTMQENVTALLRMLQKMEFKKHGDDKGASSSNHMQLIEFL
ncbi:hypothetical protein SUGI_0440250 [Cryptomeria japonica]|uniref:NAC domain-containing protein 45-like n=1 Tax=Cryptomeria japonica TaxID=3369 RepID=UPI002408C335|nr:NAC domain-containing protein 45-like [Cryptomeria japonica]XP_059075414.1 NAC domain-containing protein 45-like [Cryptomeria japonica]XP_059075416.1 NAC domain-containing protein 45-like [Cryptomeria japonica]GLJ23265.1 hypothetical protein SUGI_0440070 [Cryptomeria japonica]GLJ23266.1 hypothetical protein SUGI_0440090 [Cryptomeria japonica]GLJ23272.1 hypothetical protein SUGI_0440250 [Cryptomeria japonica]